MKVPGEDVRCEHIRCVTCADEAITVRVVALLPDNLACVEVRGEIQVVSVMAVDAAKGDLLLVHAGEAISKVEE
jgi:hydrogenase expression/formation protein HypC